MTDPGLQVIECKGDPRAMGEAQGRELRASVRAVVQGVGSRIKGRSPHSLRPFTSGQVLGKGMGLEIARHYPHLSERIQGLARGADLPIAALMDAFVREAQRPRSDESFAAPAAVVALRSAEAVRLTRRLGRREDRWLVRRSVPQVGFASVEVTLAWLATAVAGVNEAGVAAVLAPLAAGHPCDGSPAGALLIQECLQRFDSLEGCIEWTLKRPASGPVCIALADASGRAAMVEINGSDRNVSRPSEGVTAAGGDAASQARMVAGETEAEPGSAPQLIVSVDPAERRLRVTATPGAVESVHSVTAD
jgi:hypothetical protein